MSSPGEIRFVQDAELVANLLSLPLLHSVARRHPGARLRLTLPDGRHELFAATRLSLACTPYEREGGGGTLDVVTLDLRIGPGVSVPNGPRSVPLWRQYLALGEGPLLGSSEAAPAPPYLFMGLSPPGARDAQRLVVLAVDADRPEGGFEMGLLERQISGTGAARTAHLQVSSSGGRLATTVGRERVAPALRLDLMATAVWLQRAAVVVTDQRAVACLAAALGRPVVGVFCLSDEPKFHEPFQWQSTLLVADRPRDVSPAEAAAYVLEYLGSEINRRSEARSRVVLVY